MRLIDADALIERWNNMSVRGRTEFDQEIMVAPSIDIVQCKECKYYNDEDYGEPTRWCEWHESVVDADNYCSYGERKESE